MNVGLNRLAAIGVAVCSLVPCLSIASTTDFIPRLPEPTGISLTLLSKAEVDSDGVYLSDLVEGHSLIPAIRLRFGDAAAIEDGLLESRDTPPSTHKKRRILRLGDAPLFGEHIALSRSELSDLARRTLPEMTLIHWSGADRIRISRRARLLKAQELSLLLTEALQRDRVAGDLELRLTRSWPGLLVPDEPLSIKLLDRPADLSQNFTVRFEFRTAMESLGPWQMSVRAKVWRDTRR